MAGEKTRAKGTGDKVKGKAEEAWGDLTGDEKAKIKGQTDQDKGNFKRSAGKIQEKADDLTDDDRTT